MNDKNNLSGNWYNFNPMSSVNSYELAQIIRELFQIKINEETLQRMPKSTRHHFQKVTETEDKEN